VAKPPARQLYQIQTRRFSLEALNPEVKAPNPEVLQKMEAPWKAEMIFPLPVLQPKARASMLDLRPAPRSTSPLQPSSEAIFLNANNFKEQPTPLCLSDIMRWKSAITLTLTLVVMSTLVAMQTPTQVLVGMIPSTLPCSVGSSAPLNKGLSPTALPKLRRQLPPALSPPTSRHPNNGWNLYQTFMQSTPEQRLLERRCVDPVYKPPEDGVTPFLTP
jgi:hypothetical protein